MKKILYLIISISLTLFSACDVHEWPEAPEFVKLNLRLNYETDMVEWNHLYDNSSISEQGLGATYDNTQNSGTMRYIIRTYPVTKSTQEFVQEFVLTKDVTEGYNHNVTLDILPGDYNIKVWADLVEPNEEEYHHDATSFAQIKLLGSHKGSTNYRDAFRGSKDVSLKSSIDVRQPDTLDIVMQRPLAKFEFITTDVMKFIGKENTRKANQTAQSVDVEDYKVVFYYVGFMPSVYSLIADKPVDSSTGVMFESSMKMLSESEAQIGFDYVFANNNDSAVTLQIGVYDSAGEQLSLTEPIEVPLRRSHHTILKGMFLMSDAAGGVAINPDYDGNHNIVFQ